LPRKGRIIGETLMSNEGVNNGRRRFLVASTSVIGAVGAVGAAVPFVASWNPSAKAKAAGAPAKADISKLEPGQQMIVEWRGKPVWIVRRTAETLANLEKLSDKLADPASDEPQQPAYIPNTSQRSLKPEIMVMTGICTHLGCSPTYRPELAPEDLGADWLGGFFCPCHGSKFDLSGRVYKGVPAPTNLVIPPHVYETDTIIVIGIDSEGAA
jgi:ubiquinol-cytochrome c reductase iron-sulfur subunit